jgi:hypothetical protein
MMATTRNLREISLHEEHIKAIGAWQEPILITGIIDNGGPAISLETFMAMMGATVVRC